MRLWMTNLFIAIALVTSPCALADDGDESGATVSKSPAVVCPVTGKPIDRDQVTRFRNKWVYFASADALKKFEADPYEYAPGVVEQWEADRPLRLQVKCPVTGKKIDPAIYVGKGDKAIYFADEAAKKKWEARSEPYRARLDECFTYQTTCVVSNMPVDPSVSREAGGMTVLFRCGHCAGEFDSTKDKSSLLEKVKQQIARNKAAWQKRVSGSQPKATTQPSKRADKQ